MNKNVIDSFAAAIRVAGSAISAVCLPAGVAIVGTGEAITIIGNKVYERRCSVLCNSIKDHCNNTEHTNLLFSDYSRIIESQGYKSGLYEDVLNTVRKAVLCESDVIIRIMGMVISKSLDENRRLSEDELCLLDALDKMNNYDLANYSYISEQFAEFAKESKSEGLILNEYSIVNETKSDIDTLRNTAKKLDRIGFLYSLGAVDWPADEDGVEEAVEVGTFYKKSRICNLMDSYVDKLLEELSPVIKDFS